MVSGGPALHSACGQHQQVKLVNLRGDHSTPTLARYSSRWPWPLLGTFSVARLSRILKRTGLHLGSRWSCHHCSSDSDNPYECGSSKRVKWPSSAISLRWHHHRVCRLSQRFGQDCCMAEITKRINLQYISVLLFPWPFDGDAYCVCVCSLSIFD